MQKRASCKIVYILPYSKYVEQIQDGFQCLICSLTKGIQRKEMYQHVKEEHFPIGKVLKKIYHTCYLK